MRALAASALTALALFAARGGDPRAAYLARILPWPFEVRVLLAGLIGVAAVGCGAVSELDTPRGSTRGSAGGSIGAGGSAVDAGSDAGDAGDASDAYGPYGPPPVPTCAGELSKCIQNDAGVWTGSAIIHCDGVYFVGPWTLVLERQIGAQFQVVQVQVVEEPGFGTTFDDMTGPPAYLTYRVCVSIPGQGIQCGTPFVTYGAVSCACEPLTCYQIQSCMWVQEDGCGNALSCDECTGGATCNTSNHSCCPVGTQPDGTGGCECAPVVPCHGYWDPNLCLCGGGGM
jgi:hypothetical protein